MRPRDLVEAQADQRRRLVAAFATAAPTRVLVGGVALALLALAGAAAVGVADGHIPVPAVHPTAR